jgi:hypothetical protein
VELPARLVTLDGFIQAVLLDLSFKGAKVLVGAELKVGKEAELSWDSFGAFCTITWISDGQCGLKFDEPLPPHVLIATRDLADANPSGDGRRDAARQFVRGSIRL